MSKKKDDIRLYELSHGDIFSTPEKNAFDIMSKNGAGCMFVPIKKYKKVIWYKPSTWFRWIWQIKYYLMY